MSKKVKVRVENGRLVKSYLVHAATAIAHIVYVPQEHHPRAKSEVVASYLQGVKVYNPMYNTKSWIRSEERKAQIWKNIEAIREQITTMGRTRQYPGSQQYMLDKDRLYGNLVVKCLQSAVDRAKNNTVEHIVTKRAKELGVDKKYIHPEVAVRKEAIVRVSLSDRCITV